MSRLTIKGVPLEMVEKLKKLKKRRGHRSLGSLVMELVSIAENVWKNPKREAKRLKKAEKKAQDAEAVSRMDYVSVHRNPSQAHYFTGLDREGRDWFMAEGAAAVFFFFLLCFALFSV